MKLQCYLDNKTAKPVDLDLSKLRDEHDSWRKTTELCLPFFRGFAEFMYEKYPRHAYLPLNKKQCNFLLANT